MLLSRHDNSGKAGRLDSIHWCYEHDPQFCVCWLQLDYFALPFKDKPKELYNLLRGRKILFLGDSIITQSWQAFVCFVHSNIQVKSNFIPGC